MCSILTYLSPSADMSLFEEMLKKTASRGPDQTRIIKTDEGILGFNRLSIMGLSPEGMQPFELNGSFSVCNGELYGFRPLKAYLEDLGYAFAGESDCELILPLYERLGVSMFSFLDAEFAMVIYDARSHEFIAARDPIGIRPLYYGYDSKGSVIFASEPKNLVGVCTRIMPFPPGHY